MLFDRTRFMEHLALDCPHWLRHFCDAARERFGLPAFAYDCENETQWGWVEYEGIEYNVSRPYDRDTLEGWDGSVPFGCNFGVTLSVSWDCPADWDAVWSTTLLVPRVGQGLADLFGRPVYHHRTTFADGDNKIRHLFKRRVFRTTLEGATARNRDVPRDWR